MCFLNCYCWKCYRCPLNGYYIKYCRPRYDYKCKWIRPDRKQDLSGKQSKGIRRIIYQFIKITKVNMCGDNKEEGQWPRSSNFRAWRKVTWMTTISKLLGALVLGHKIQSWRSLGRNMGEWSQSGCNDPRGPIPTCRYWSLWVMLKERPSAWEGSRKKMCAQSKVGF